MTHLPTLRARYRCEWTEDDDGVFESTCGRAFILNDGTPADKAREPSNGHPMTCRDCAPICPECLTAMVRIDGRVRCACPEPEEEADG